MLQQSLDGMWEWVDTNDPEHLDLLAKFGILESVKQSYSANLVCGGEEMRTFANTFNFENNEQAIIVTYYINHMLNIASGLDDKFKDLTNYTEVGRKFHINYLVSQTFKCLNSLSTGINSLTSELELSSDHSFLLYVKSKLNYAYGKLGLEANRALMDYRTYMDFFELPFLSSADINDLKQFILSATDPRNQSSADNEWNREDIYDNPEWEYFYISKFSSTKTHPFFRFDNPINTFIQQNGFTLQLLSNEQNSSVRSSTPLESEISMEESLGKKDKVAEKTNKVSVILNVAEKANEVFVKLEVDTYEEDKVDEESSQVFENFEVETLEVETPESDFSL